MIITLLFFLVIFFTLQNIFNWENKNSTSALMRQDAKKISVPKSGGKGKSIIVIGGGISGLSASKYLLEAGFDVQLLESKKIMGGNNDPYLDKNMHLATTVIITFPSQQPHYLNLCRELNIEQTPHPFSSLEGSIILEDRTFKVRMGAGPWVFLKAVIKQCSIKEIFDGMLILFLFYRQFKWLPESKKSVKDVLGENLVNSSVFTHIFMPWIGINTWCRFDDITVQPAHIFGSFIFEYALTSTKRFHEYLPGENGWCVLDGRLIHALEKHLKTFPNYNFRNNSKVMSISRDPSKKFNVTTNDGAQYNADLILCATQPFQAIPLIEKIAPNNLVSELKKWPKMNCYVVLHVDYRAIQNMPWVHQTYYNKITSKHYITNTIKPIMSNEKQPFVITFVYNTDNYDDFIENKISKDKIIKVLEPKLPIFTLENSINRNQLWSKIDSECTDIYWTQSCKSGLQYHNNGILASKRVVKAILEKNASV